MRRIFQTMRNSKFVVFTSGFAMLFALGATAMPYFFLRSVTPPLIVHFTEFSHIDRVGTFWDISGIGILGVVFVAMNALIALELEARKSFWAKFLSLATLYLAALIFIGVSAIISVN